MGEFKRSYHRYIERSLVLFRGIRKMIGRGGFVGVLVFVALATLDATTAASQNGTNTAKVDSVIKKSPVCSRSGTYFLGERTRYVCGLDSEVVALAVSLARNEAVVRAARVAAGLASTINNTNYTNSTQLANQTFLEQLGKPLLNESLVAIPCKSEAYNVSFCACPLDRSGPKCDVVRKTRCSLRWLNPNIKDCIKSNGKGLSEEDRGVYDVEIDGVPPCVRFDMKNSKYVWKVNLSCSFSDTQRRKCNGSTATADAILSSGLASNSENNVFKTNQCLEDTTVDHWYNNGRPGASMWVSQRDIGESRVAVKFYSMLDPFTKSVVFQSAALTGAQINGPSSTVDIEIRVKDLNAVPELVSGGRMYSEGKFMPSKFMSVSVDEKERLLAWGNDEPSIVVDVQGYKEPLKPPKELLGGEIALIVILTLAAFFAVIMWWRHYKKEKDD